jgi:putative endonuclease
MLDFLRTYTTYIVQCSDGTFYVGMTRNLEERLKQHNGELQGGAKYTQGRRPIVLKYHENHETYGSAARKEIALKKLSRKQKEKLINVSR